MKAFKQKTDLNANITLQRSILSNTPGLAIQRKCSNGNSNKIDGIYQKYNNKMIGLQTKLKIGQSGDKYEQEADRVADQVMRMEQSQTNDISQQSRSIQTKPLIRRQVADARSDETEVSAIVHDVLKTAGQPLSKATRRHMESRFDHDFRQVRIHNGNKAEQSANAVNAKAYTVGSDIVFGSGQYAPGTNKGKHLLAHELTHVVQQSRPEGNRNVQRDEKDGLSPVVPVREQRGVHRIQRKINVSSGVSINSHLVSGATKSGNLYSHPGASQTSLTDQIITDILISPRVFSVKGSNDLDAGKNFSDHIKARKGIVDFAANKRYTFAAGATMTMNSKYWQEVGPVWRVKPGVDSMKAMKDVNATPGKYKIACLAATTITMVAGSGGSPLTYDVGVAASDWVPGDWGYIQNTKFVSGTTTIGLEGENIIYTGAQMFWGHFTGSNTYRSLQDWAKEVNNWHTPGGAVIQSHRKRPTIGLV